MVIKRESIKYSLNNLKQRRVRSSFTIISILIGIATIFLFVSFGLGLFNYVQDFSEGSSANKIIVQPKGIGTAGFDTTFKLTEDDLDAVEKTSGVFDAEGAYFKTVKVQKGSKVVYALAFGYDPDKSLLIETFGVDILEGRELGGGSGEVVLGYNYFVDGKLFDRSYSLGQNIEVNGEDFKIVGFYEAVGSPQDDAQIYMSDESLKKLYSNETLSYNWIVAEVDTSNIDRVVENVEDSLRDERNLDEGKEDFFVQSFTDLIDSYKDVLNIIVGFIILIALISVIVSAVNTANTMITSVLERVKEIGVMKSIGSRNSEIFKIFLFESSFLGFIAGVLGVGLGWVLSFAGGKILVNVGYGFLQPAFPALLFVGCILFATLTGAISGVIPAYKAMKTNPVDALRYE